MAKRAQPRLSRRLTLRKSAGIDDEGRLDEATLRRFVFQTFGRARRTQDSPVMPDVWLRYIRAAERLPMHGAAIARRYDRLLLTPWSGSQPGEIAKRLRENLARQAKAEKSARQGSRQTARMERALRSATAGLSLCVDFESLVRDVVPFTGWWQRLLRRKDFEAAFNMMEETARKTKRPSGPDVELHAWRRLSDLSTASFMRTRRRTFATGCIGSSVGTGFTGYGRRARRAPEEILPGGN